MHRGRFVAMGIGIVLAGTIGRGVAFAARVTVPDGTMVELASTQPLLTYTIAKGSTFNAIVKSAVVVNGYVIIKAGAAAQGTIVDSVFGDTMREMPQTPNGPQVERHGFTIEGKEQKGPPLEVRFDWAQGVDGLKLRLGDVTTDGDSNGNPAQTSPKPTYLLQTVTKLKKRSIFNMNPTYDVGVKSGAGSIPPSQVFSARIVGPVHTVTSLRAGDSSNDGFAH